MSAATTILLKSSNYSLAKLQYYSAHWPIVLTPQHVSLSAPPRFPLSDFRHHRDFARPQNLPLFGAPPLCHGLSQWVSPTISN